jgi:hypothetical protein
VKPEILAPKPQASFPFILWRISWISNPVLAELDRTSIQLPSYSNHRFGHCIRPFLDYWNHLLRHAPSSEEPFLSYRISSKAAWCIFAVGALFLFDLVWKAIRGTITDALEITIAVVDGLAFILTLSVLLMHFWQNRIEAVQ